MSDDRVASKKLSSLRRSACAAHYPRAPLLPETAASTMGTATATSKSYATSVSFGAPFASAVADPHHRVIITRGHH